MRASSIVRFARHRRTDQDRIREGVARGTSRDVQRDRYRSGYLSLPWRHDDAGALDKGVPVVLWQGDRHVSRVGASLLTNAGLADLIADSDEQFVEIASQLAADLDALSLIRALCVRL